MIGKRTRTTHGMSKTRLYYLYRGMITRCYSVNQRTYQRYGAKGVTVCEEWRNSKEAFFEWALSHGYSDELTLDRIDNSKGYCPENCRWATPTEQANNRKSNHIITANGESHTIAEWARITGIKSSTIKSRLHKGWNEVKAVTTPTLQMGSWRKKGE